MVIRNLGNTVEREGKGIYYRVFLGNYMSMKTRNYLLGIKIYNFQTTLY